MNAEDDSLQGLVKYLQDAMPHSAHQQRDNLQIYVIAASVIGRYLPLSHAAAAIVQTRRSVQIRLGFSTKNNAMVLLELYRSPEDHLSIRLTQNGQSYVEAEAQATIGYFRTTVPGRTYKAPFANLISVIVHWADQLGVARAAHQ